MTRIRDDKTWQTATSLAELKILFAESKECTKNIDLETKENQTVPTQKRPSPSSPSTSSQAITSPAKKKVKRQDSNEDDDIVYTLGASGKSYDKISIKACKSGFHLEVLQGDLFKMTANDETVSLAHCVSRDLKMSKGIAKIFRDKYGRVQELEKMNAGIGEVAVLKLNNQNRFVYNLVTKARYSDFPSYDSLQQSLLAMKKHAIENSVQAIAMPKIGCGLDKLEWNAVRTLLKNLFLDTSIHLRIYTLEKIEACEKKPVVAISNGKSKNNTRKYYPMLDIAEDTLTPISATNGHFKQDKKGTELKFKALPDIFQNDKIFLQSGMENQKLLERYIIAYGGEIAQVSQATVIVRDSTKDPKTPLVKNAFGVIAKKSVPQVTEDWIYDCITAQKRQKL